VVNSTLASRRDHETSLPRRGVIMENGEYKCELCGGKAEFFGHIQFLEGDHVAFFCKKCLMDGKLAPFAIYDVFGEEREGK